MIHNEQCWQRNDIKFDVAEKKEQRKRENEKWRIGKDNHKEKE